MDPNIFDELAEMLLQHRSQALVKLREMKRERKLSSEDVHLMIKEFINPTRTEAHGRAVGLHTQLARTRSADCSVPDREARGTPPQRHSWSLADRRNEPIRRGSPEWETAKAKLRATKNNVQHSEDEESSPVKSTVPPVTAPVQNAAYLFSRAPIQDFAPVESIDPYFEGAFPHDSLAPVELLYPVQTQVSPTEESVTFEKSAHVVESAPPVDAPDPFVEYSEDDDDRDDGEEPGTKWGRVEGGRDRRHRIAARLRCASRQPSSLRSSWSAA